MSDELELQMALGVRRGLISVPSGEDLVSDKPEEEVRHVYWSVLRLDGRGAFLPGATHWRQQRNGIVPDSDVWFLQLLLLQTETSSEGSVRPIVSEQDSPQQYEQVLRLAAKLALGKATTDDRHSFKSKTTCDRRVNLKFLHDVEQMKKIVLYEFMMKEKNKKNKKRKTDAADSISTASAPKGRGRGAARDVSDEDEENQRAPAPPVVPICPSNARPVMFDFSIFVPEQDDRGDEEQDLKAHLAKIHTARVNFQSHEMFKVQKQQYLEDLKIYNEYARVNGEAAEGGEDDPEKPDWENFTGNETIVSKIRFTVTPMPDAENNIVALVCCFIVRDPAINPGEFFRKVCANQVARASGGQKGRGGNGHYEMFVDYECMFASNHPASNYTNNERYYKCAIDIDPSLASDGNSRVKRHEEFDYVSFSSKFHLTKILTIEHVLAVLDECNVNPKYTSDPNDWWESAAKTVRYPSDLKTYKYISDAVWWYNVRFMGLCEQYFPHISVDDEWLSKLGATSNAAVLLGEKDSLSAEERAHANEVEESIKRKNALISGSYMVNRNHYQSRSKINYPTNNEFIHLYDEAKWMETQVMKHFPAHIYETQRKVASLKAEWGEGEWRNAADEELMVKIKECEVYAAIRTRAQSAKLKVFSSLWQLEGNVDDLPIPRTIKAMLKWYQNQSAPFPHLSREFVMYDPDMGMFGNAILQMLIMYSCVGKIINPVICIMAIGLFSCYHQGRDLKCHFRGVGSHATGKSKTAINTFIDNSIPGTTSMVTGSSSKSDTTMNHVYDSILLSDETQNRKVDAKAAKQFQDENNKDKVKMVENQLGYTVFDSLKRADGESVRWTKTILTDHFYSSVELTNTEMSSRDALASRYWCFKMPVPKVPLYEFGGQMDSYLSDTTKTFLCINQFLTACAMKCATVGGMLPEPEKETWSALNARVIDYLTTKKVIKDTEVIRDLDIMWSMVREFIYMWAIRCAFDMPGGANYYKKFTPEMIQSIQPYLYCTVEIFWWGWTALGSAFVEDDNSKFITAVEEVCGFRKACGNNPGIISNYTVYEQDVNERVRFRRWDKSYCNEQEKEELIDLNYLEVDGTIDQFAVRVAASIEGISPTDVKGMLNKLQDHTVKVNGGPYERQPISKMKRWHRAQSLNPLRKMTDEDLVHLPLEYQISNHDGLAFRTEEDMPRRSENEALPVVEIDHQNRKIYVMPNIADHFKSDVIVKALIHATASSSFPEGKIMMGAPSEHNNIRLQNQTFTRESIDKHVAAVDKINGWEMDEETGDVKWTKSKFISERERPVSLTKGVATNRRAGISFSDARVLGARPTVPVAKGDQQWKKQSESSMKAMSVIQDVIDDIDRVSATRQWLRMGGAVDGEVPTPTVIKQRYIAACEKEGREWTLHMDYPHDWDVETEKNEAIWRGSKPSGAVMSCVDVIYNQTRGVATKPKNARTREALNERNELKKSRIQEEMLKDVVLSKKIAEERQAAYDRLVQTPAVLVVAEAEDTAVQPPPVVVGGAHKRQKRTRQLQPMHGGDDVRGVGGDFEVGISNTQKRGRE